MTAVERAEQGASSQREDSDARSVSPKHRYELGIVFVHGIGEQREGDTLRAFGEPTFQWIKDRVGDDADVSLGVTRLHPEGNGGSSKTAHAVLTLRTPDGHATKWLLAESWWAEKFPPPSFPQVLAWTFGIIPWITLTQGIDSLPPGDDDSSGGSRATRFWSDLMRGIQSTLMLALVLPVSLIIQAVGLVLAVFALVPGLNRFAGWVQRFLGSGLGDSYALLTSPMALSSMITKIRDDIESVAAASCDVAIVAHSQGSALARRALKLAHVPKVARFITVGEAIGKLEALDILFRSPRAVWAASTGSILAGAMTVLFILSLPNFFDWVPVSIQWGLAGLALSVWIAVLRSTAIALGFGVRHLTQRREAEIALGSYSAPFRWHDLWASADPVPNGPLVRDNKRIAVHSHEVRNLSSIVRDHTSYVRNRDEFLPRLIASLPLRAPTQGLLGLTEKTLSDGADHRHRRIQALVGARFLALLLFGFIVWRTRHAWASVGNRDEWCWSGLRTAVDALPSILRSPLSATLLKGNTECLRIPWLILIPPAALAISSLLWSGWNVRATSRFMANRVSWTKSDWMSWGLVAAVPAFGAAIVLPLAHTWYPRAAQVPTSSLIAVIAGFAFFSVLAYRRPARLYDSFWASTRGDKDVKASSKDLSLVIVFTLVLLPLNLPLGMMIQWGYLVFIGLAHVGVLGKGGKDQSAEAWWVSVGFLLGFGFLIAFFLSGSFVIMTLGVVAAALIGTLYFLQGLRRKQPEYWVPGWSSAHPTSAVR